MRRLRLCLALLFCFLAASAVKADTVNFTVTINRQEALHTVPVGTVYTGFLHYEGSIDPNFTGYPPIPTSYGFNYPSAPASLADFKWAFLQRHYIGGPLFAGLMYTNYAYPGASFDMIGDLFEIILPNYEEPNAVGYTVGETGTVAYTYTSDPAPAVPEPFSFMLVGTGLVGAWNLRRFHRA
ncbi:MAG TPA: hypothetical protein VFS41_09910 [Edaphobacter sp.]|nr:hypothetical protein [Edaphobacter sp.]